VRVTVSSTATLPLPFLALLVLLVLLPLLVLPLLVLPLLVLLLLLLLLPFRCLIIPTTACILVCEGIDDSLALLHIINVPRLEAKAMHHVVPATI